MKIDIYTLLGMIKDNKAPKKIAFKEDIYEYRCSDCIDYYCDNDSGWLFDDYDITNILNEEVTILETTLNTENMNITPFEIKNNEIHGTWKNGAPYHYTLSAPQMVLAEKMLEIIEVINND